MPKSQIFTRPSGGQQDVGGLDVSVNDAAAVRVIEGLSALKEDLDNAFDGQQIVLVDVSLQGVAAVDELQHDIGLVGVFAGVEHAENIRVIQGAGGVRFVEKQFLCQAAGLGLIFIHDGADFDGDLAIGKGVMPGVDDAHAAAADAADDLVFADLLRNLHRVTSLGRNWKYGREVELFL